MQRSRRRTGPIAVAPDWQIPLSAPAGTDAHTKAMLAELHDRVTAAEPYNIGYPAATDVDWSPLAPVLSSGLRNNVGSPDDDGIYQFHTKPMEREVIQNFADLFRAPRAHRGYVTDGASGGNLWALEQARKLHPNAIVVFSEAAHYSVPKAADILAMQTVVVRADASGEMNYHDLRHQITAHPGRPVVMVANIGTTMTEAHDDIRLINEILDVAGVERRWTHCDAAMCGVQLGLMRPEERPGMDFADGADSIVVSGHKFLATLRPCAVVIARTSSEAGDGVIVPYIDARDVTIAGSRDGYGPLMLWWVMRTLGWDGLRRRAANSRVLAGYTVRRLESMGWTAFRNPRAFTVVLKTPPLEVARRWNLPTQDGWSHIVCMPGVTRTRIDAFLDHMARELKPGRPKRQDPVVGRIPRQAA